MKVTLPPCQTRRLYEKHYPPGRINLRMSQSFTNHQPLIIAMGGGTTGERVDTYSSWESSSPPNGDHYPVTTTLADRLAVEDTGCPHPNLLLLTTASEDGHHNVDQLVDALTKQYQHLGVGTVKTLRLVQEPHTVPHAAELINWADIIYVTGGNTHQMMRVWHEHHIHEMLTDARRRGTIMIGTSAGAICWAKSGWSNSFYTNRPFRVDGLGWINTIICPHHDAQPFRQDTFNQYLRINPHLVGIALPEQAALLTRDLRTITIMAMQPSAVPAHLQQGDRIRRLAFDEPIRLDALTMNARQ